MFQAMNTWVLLGIFFMTFAHLFTPSKGLCEEKFQAMEYVYPDQSIWTTKTDASGILENPLLKLADALFTKLEIEWTAKPYPANRMFKRLEEGVSNFSMLVRASRLKESCIFSRQPVVTTELRVYRPVGASPIVDMEDLKGKNIITIRGYSYGAIGKYLKDAVNGIVTFEAPLHESAFEMLKNKRAEYLLDYTGPSEEILKTNPIPGVTSDVLNTLGVFLVLSKSYPEAQKMMDTLEQAAATIDVSQWGLNNRGLNSL